MRHGRIVSFALGSIWRWSDDRNALVNYARGLGVSGIEITFASKEELYSFHLTKDNSSWLKSLDYVTIHAPFYLISESEDERELLRQLNSIAALYDDFDAKNVIIHPDELPPSDLLKKYRFNVITENLSPENSLSIADLRRVFHTHPALGLCIDVSHAYLWSEHETGNIVAEFKRRISQVHFSGTHNNKDHQSLRNVADGFLRSIRPIEEMDVPIVIEEDIHVRDFDYLKQEVEYIKSMFIC